MLTKATKLVGSEHGRMSATKVCGGGAKHGVDFRISRAQEREGTRVGRRVGGRKSAREGRRARQRAWILRQGGRMRRRSRERVHGQMMASQRTSAKMASDGDAMAREME
jgi:hypothetical protein